MLYYGYECFQLIEIVLRILPLAADNTCKLLLMVIRWTREDSIALWFHKIKVMSIVCMVSTAMDSSCIAINAHIFTSGMMRVCCH